jgi:hypothetical protein
MDKKNNYGEWLMSSELSNFFDRIMTEEEKIKDKTEFDAFVAKLKQKNKTQKNK